MKLFFSYGVLQFEKTQIETFGKPLPSKKDIVKGYKLDNIKVVNPEMVTLMDNNFHPIAKPSNNPNDEIIGTVFELNEDDLAKAEAFTNQCKTIKKIEVTLDSGKKSWMYVANQ
ncbi:gamma-glutamylcyclotransferase family protein [Wenyingzhuangia sp. IMCC45467]